MLHNAKPWLSFLCVFLGHWQTKYILKNIQLINHDWRLQVLRWLLFSTNQSLLGIFFNWHSNIAKFRRKGKENLSVSRSWFRSRNISHSNTKIYEQDLQSQNWIGDFKFDNKLFLHCKELEVFCQGAKKTNNKKHPKQTNKKEIKKIQDLLHRYWRRKPQISKMFTHFQWSDLHNKPWLLKQDARDNTLVSSVSIASYFIKWIRIQYFLRNHALKYSSIKCIFTQVQHLKYDMTF